MQPLRAVLDHLVYVTPSLDATIERIEELFGVRAAIGGHHKAWRTRNALLSLGERMYLEIMGPDESHPAANQPRPFGMDEMSTPRLATWVARSSDIQKVIGIARRDSLDLGALQEGSRQKPDGSILRWTMTDLTKAREGGIIPYFTDWADSLHPAESSPKGCTLLMMKVAHPEANRIRRILINLGIDVAVEAGPQPAIEAIIETPKGQYTLV